MRPAKHAFNKLIQINICFETALIVLFRQVEKLERFHICASVDRCHIDTLNTRNYLKLNYQNMQLLNSWNSLLSVHEIDFTVEEGYADCSTYQKSFSLLSWKIWSINMRLMEA